MYQLFTLIEAGGCVAGVAVFAAMAFARAMTGRVSR